MTNESSIEVVTGVQTLEVALGERSYPVVLTPELPGQETARQARRLLGSAVGGRVFVVTDTIVGPLYEAGVRSALEAVGLTVQTEVVPAGEASKSIETWARLVEAVLAAGIRRSDLIIALGGGVVGDLAGFVAATVLRGVRVIQVPTTLLAQVDSSVGGKTAVNVAAGKNLVGAFWQPSAVVASQAVLTTLAPRERRCGLAEAVKHGFIADTELVAWAVRNGDALGNVSPPETAALVARCVQIKADVVARDEREGGVRAILNFGHTFGHAYERELGYGRLTHGEAVALGMVVAAELSVRLSVTQSPGLVTEVTEAIKSLGLPHEPFAPELPSLDRLLGAASGDKKAVDGEHVRFVLLRNSGEPLIQVLPWAHIREALEPCFSSRRPT